AHERVDVAVTYSGEDISVTLHGDRPGLAPQIMDTGGEPYVTSSRPRRVNVRGAGGGGLGLGVFIAKTLRERSGATLTFENRVFPERGAIVHARWNRADLEVAGAPSVPA